MGKKRKFGYNADQTAEKKRFKEVRSAKLMAGIPGILITHDRGREKICRIESFQLLNYYADQWYGKETDVHFNKPTSNDSSEDEIDIAGALNQELSELKNDLSSEKQSKRRFSTLKSGCNNVIFIKTGEIKPSDFVQRIVEDILKFDKGNCIPLPKQVLRMHPGDISCKAHLNSIKLAAESYLPTAFNKTTEKLQNADESSFSKEFSVLYRGRNNDHLGMHVVTDAICEVAKEVCPMWKHNCRSSVVVVLVDVIANVCLMSVVHEYIKHKKFNIKELLSAKHPHVSKNSGNV